MSKFLQSLKTKKMPASEFNIEERNAEKQKLAEHLAKKYETSFLEIIKNMRIKTQSSVELQKDEFTKNGAFKLSNIVFLVFAELNKLKDSLFSIINWKIREITHTNSFSILFFLKDKDSISTAFGLELYQTYETKNQKSKEEYDASKLEHLNQLIVEIKSLITKKLIFLHNTWTGDSNLWFLWKFSIDKITNGRKFPVKNMIHLLLSNLCAYGEDLSVLFWHIIDKKTTDEFIFVNFTMKTEEQIEAFEAECQKKGVKKTEVPSVPSDPLELPAWPTKVVAEEKVDDEEEESEEVDDEEEESKEVDDEAVAEKEKVDDEAEEEESDEEEDDA